MSWVVLLPVVLAAATVLVLARAARSLTSEGAALRAEGAALADAAGAARLLRAALDPASGGVTDGLDGAASVAPTGHR